MMQVNDPNTKKSIENMERAIEEQGIAQAEPTIKIISSEWELVGIKALVRSSAKYTMEGQEREIHMQHIMDPDQLQIKALMDKFVEELQMQHIIRNELDLTETVHMDLPKEQKNEQEQRE